MGQGEIIEHVADANMAVPDSFDSEKAWPHCAKIIGDIRDQSNCGCCWAFAGAEAGSDRMCISSNASIMIPLSAQDVCFNAGSFFGGCDGGQITDPWTYLKKGDADATKHGAVSGGQYKGSGPFGKGFCSDFSLPHCHHHGPKWDADAKAPHNDFSADKYSYTGSTVTVSGVKGI